MNSKFKLNDIVQVNSKASNHHKRSGRVRRLLAKGEIVEVVFESDDDTVKFAPEELTKVIWKRRKTDGK